VNVWLFRRVRFSHVSLSHASLWQALSACAAVLLGAAAQLQQAQLASVSVYAGLCVGAVLVGLLVVWLARAVDPPTQARRLTLNLLGMGCIAGLVFASTGWRACNQAKQQLPADLEGVNLIAEGEVMGLPQQHPEGLRFRFRVDRLTDAQGHALLPSQGLGWLWLGWYSPHRPSVQGAERWRLPVRLKAPHGHVNPHGFDFELWLWEQNIAATGYVRERTEGDAAVRLAPASAGSVTSWRGTAREAIFQTVADPHIAGVLAALLVGDQASIDRSDWDVFRATGVAHLMAISGLHITGVAWLGGLAVGALWRRCRWRVRGRVPALWCATPHVRRVAGVTVGLAYAVFSGWGVPAQRTVWMLGIVHALAMHGRRWPWPLTWSVVAAALVVWDPWALLQAGFWLSFVAVGLLFAAGREVDAREQATTWKVRVMRAMRALWREQWLMTVCLSPLCVLLFQQLSVVGIVANLLAVPWVTLVVTPLCLLGVLWAPAWHAAAAALTLMMPLLQTLAAWPWAQWSVAAAPLCVGVFALLGGVCMAMPGPAWWRWGGLCWCVPLLTWHNPRPPPGQFELLAADMGQGHAVLLRTHHHALLYDTGPRYSSETDAGQRVLVPLLRSLGERLDRVVLSHQDADHSGGLRAVMAMQTGANLLTSVPSTHPMMQGVSGNVQPCLRGQHWQWDGVQFDILHPRDSLGVAKPNAVSCVLRVTDAQGVTALLAGDIEAAQEQTLIASDDALAADWLLVPHHGSNTSSTSGFIAAVHPRWAVVQAGYRNRYGHPRPEVMARYAAQHIAVVQTVSCGAAWWRSGAPKEMTCQRQVERHYWRR
jgi:competence protein ComEC